MSPLTIVCMVYIVSIYFFFIHHAENSMLVDFRSRRGLWTDKLSLSACWIPIDDIIYDTTQLKCRDRFYEYCKDSLTILVDLGYLKQNGISARSYSLSDKAKLLVGKEIEAIYKTIMDDYIKYRSSTLSSISIKQINEFNYKYYFYNKREQIFFGLTNDESLNIQARHNLLFTASELITQDAELYS